MPTILLDNVTKLYKNGKAVVKAIRDVSLEIEPGEFVFIVGSRGAGASTLLKLMSGTLAPDQGIVYLDGVNAARMSKWQIARRDKYLGYVPQESNLIRTETVLRNMTTVKKRFGRLKKVNTNSVLIRKALGLVGMSGCEDRYPLEFSISECRRIELARALLTSPKILLLDEFTDRMDDDTIWDMLHLMFEINKRGTTVVMATHARQFVNIMRKRVITLVDGRVVGDVKRGRFGTIM